MNEVPKSNFAITRKRMGVVQGSAYYGPNLHKTHVCYVVIWQKTIVYFKEECFFNLTR